MNKKNYYILGIKYFNEHIDMNTNEMVEISDKINNENDKWDFIHGLTNAMHNYHNGIDFAHDSIDMRNEEIIELAKKKANESDDKAILLFVKGVIQELNKSKENNYTK